MKKIKYWIIANILLLLLCPISIYLWMNVLGWGESTRVLRVFALGTGVILYLVNRLTVLLNIILITILCYKLARNKQLDMKQLLFILFSVSASIGYIVLYVFFLRGAVSSLLA